MNYNTCGNCGYSYRPRTEAEINKTRQLNLSERIRTNKKILYFLK